MSRVLNLNMNNNEKIWDELIKVKTTGRDASRANQYHYPYEPTPYPVLERLTNSGLLRKNDVILDYGCGKGRVEFFISYQTRAKTIGIEYDERIYAAARSNQKTAISADYVSFLLQKAEDYEVPSEVNRFYFFNPFSIEILRKVMAKIIDSYYQEPRRMLLFFYYPSDEYISYLMTIEELEFMDEIDCRDLFKEDNQRERIVIFQVRDIG